MTPAVLSIAGSDPSGGAGLQADLKTFHQHGVFGMAIPTLLTVQSSAGVFEVHRLEADFIATQLEALLADVTPRAVKTGALGEAAVAALIGERLRDLPGALVVDPVLRSSSGRELYSTEHLEVLRRQLLPRCTLVTPNLEEARALLGGRRVEGVEQMKEAARALADLGAPAVLVKGGHLRGDPWDVLLEGGELSALPGIREVIFDPHGTGCALSAAITARLAHGEPLARAVAGARRYVAAAIRAAQPLGKGRPFLDFHAGTEGPLP